jgi:hypothetical protein
MLREDRPVNVTAAPDVPVEESRTWRFAELLENSRLIPSFSFEEQWSQRSIVLDECGGQVATLSDR